MNPKIRLLLVDDHSLMRIGLATSLNLEADMAVVAEASTGAGALECYRQHRPDVVLMDWRLPGMSGDEITARLCAEFPEAKVVMLTTYDATEDIFRAVQAGARSFLSKDVMLEELLRAIRTVQAGQNYFPPAIAARLVERMHTAELSTREREVLDLIVTGWANKEIASRLFISETTVKDHVGKILSKLKARDRTHAGMIAIQRGIVHIG